MAERGKGRNLLFSIEPIFAPSDLSNGAIVIWKGTVKTVAARFPKAPNKAPKLELVREELYGAPYEYYALGKYIVAARGVCGGRPTIKHHRLDARHIIGCLKAGDKPQQIARNYKIPVAAVNEAIELSSVYDYQKSYA